MKKVEFKGQVTEVKSRMLATQDKGGRLVLEFNVYDDALIGQLSALIQSETEVSVTIKANG